ncbi:MAG: galactose-1-phosphate uridylyltransferase [candidate division Zixibacteria bacterium]|nr:galactose-1-phosphate uridylyltransferase [candidate division Zixibacteria bacterium]
MSTLRRDPVLGRWVVNTDKLDTNSTTLENLYAPYENGQCPFCQGNEHLTPPEIFALRPADTQANTPGWETRVIPNNTPALNIHGKINRRADLMYDMMDSIGAHEIVVGTPEHIPNMADLSEDQFNKIFSTYKQRFIDLKRDSRLRCAFAYKTYGKRAFEESIPHSHSHIIATPMTPKLIKEQYFGARNYYRYKNRCVYCDFIRQEVEKEKRLIKSNEKFIAIAPFASRFSHEVWILPREHHCDFEDCSEKDIPYFSSLVKDILLRIRTLLDDPPYNFALITGPNRKDRESYWSTIEEDYHWHLEIMPTFTKTGGFEWATGFYINDTTPEKAAARLREIKL